MVKILAVDDKQDNLTTLSALLRNMIPEATVITAQSGEEAITKALTELPDTILLDMKMPGKDGYEVCKRLKSDEITKHIPVVMISAIKTDQRSRIKGLQIGADAFLAKPIDEYELAAQVKAMLRIKYTDDEYRKDRNQLKELVKARTESIKKINEELQLSITERKRVEKDFRKTLDLLEKSEQRFRRYYEFGLIGMAETSLEKRWVDVNDRLCEILGYSRDELLKKTWIELTHSDDIALEIAEFNRVLKGDIDSYSVEKRFIHKKGKTIYTIMSAKRVSNPDGSANHFITLVQDITNIKEMEHRLLQSEKLRSLGELTRGIAHDFNNLLAVILGNAQLLQISIGNLSTKYHGEISLSEIKEGLDIIERASRKGADTVKRIQGFSREKDDVNYFKAVNINNTIDCSLDLTRARWKDDAESKGIRIDIKKEYSSLPSVLGSVSELLEVFISLIHNAIDAMPRGGQINITTFTKDNHVFIRFNNTGAVIPKNIIDNIFDPFFTTKGVNSSGLGLSVSYGIINRHRGTITVVSFEYEGTTFKITLPIPGDSTEVKRVKSLSEVEKKARILVIEDEEQVRTLLSAIVLKAGHEIEIASNGEQGLALFEEGEYDMVLTDLGMPGMTGWQVAEKIKTINNKVPVVLITGWDITPDQLEMNRRGVNLIIHKPFEMEQVLSTIDKAIILRDRFNTH